MMFDRLRSKEAATVSAVVALGLGITACGSNETDTQPIVKHNTHSSFTYKKDGSAVANIHGDGYDVITEVCQGSMFLAETYSGNGANSIEAIPDSPYCDDGRLTPSDFQLDPSK